LGSRYVVVKFGNQRAQTTPMVKKGFSAEYPANESTFDLPVFASVVGTRGALLEIVVWKEWGNGKGIQHVLFVGVELTARMATTSAV
jgi:hypothetical protein